MKKRELIEKLNQYDDDFEIDIYGQYSNGSFGTPIGVETTVTDLPDGSKHKEIQIVIKA